MVTNSPCARLMTFIKPKMIARPSATSMRMLMRVRALRTSGIRASMLRTRDRGLAGARRGRLRPRCSGHRQEQPMLVHVSGIEARDNRAVADCGDAVAQSQQLIELGGDKND